MADKITDPDEVSRALVAGFKEDVKACITMAVAVGWTMYVNKDKGVTIVAPPPNDHKKYHFTQKRTSGPLRRITKDVWKFGDPERIKIISEVMNSNSPHDFNVSVASEIASAFFEGNVERGNVQHEPDPEPEKPKEPKPVPRHLVSTRPMMAKRGEDSGYESKVAMERHWSDGTVDYSCAFPGCKDGTKGRPYTSDNRLSVRNHWRKHGETAPPPKREDIIQVSVPHAAAYAPQQRRVEALAAVLQGIDLSDPEAVARAALTWVGEQSRRNTEHSTEREPLTAEETLDRIRNLIDDGGSKKAAAEAIELREKVDHLTVELTDVRMQVKDAQENANLAIFERDKALEDLRATQSDLSGLQDLLGQITARFGPGVVEESKQ